MNHILSSIKGIRVPPYVGLILLFALFFGIYHVNDRELPEIDCLAGPYGAWSLIHHGNFDLQHYEVSRMPVVAVTAIDGTSREASKYPVGTMISYVPIMSIYSLFLDSPPSKGTSVALGKLMAAFYVALGMVVFYKMVKSRIPQAALASTLLLGFGTALWPVASQASWAHGPATFFIIVAMSLSLPSALQSDPKEHSPQPASLNPALAVLCLGLAIMTRPTAILFVPALLSPYILRRQWGQALIGSCATLCMLSLFLIYNYFYFGTLASGGYGQEADQFTTPFFYGLAGQTIAPSNGMFVYTPAFLLVPFGIWALCRTTQWPKKYAQTLIAWLLCAIMTVFLYSTWHSWFGGWSYGPRLLIETFPVFAVFFAHIWNYSQSRVARTIQIGLVTLSISVQAVGIFGWGGGSFSKQILGGIPTGSAESLAIKSSSEFTIHKLNLT